MGVALEEVRPISEERYLLLEKVNLELSSKETYYKTAVRKILGFKTDEPVIEDVIQRTIISIARSKTGYRGDNGANLSSWLYKSIKNSAMNYKKYEGIRLMVSRDEHDPDESYFGVENTFFSAIYGREGLKTLEKELDEIPPVQRHVFNLHMEGLDREEISKELGMKPATVGGHICNTRKRLKYILDY